MCDFSAPVESYLPAAAEDYEYEEEALAGYNPGQVGWGAPGRWRWRGLGR